MYVNGSGKTETVTITHKPQTTRQSWKSKRGSATQSTDAMVSESSDTLQFGDLGVTAEAEKVTEFLKKMRTDEPPEK